MILKLEQVTKRFAQPGGGHLTVLDKIDFSIAAGDTTAIVGQSGSGKTTLLSLMAGLDRPDAGKILLDDEDLAAMTQDRLSRYRAEKIGIVFQNFHLMPHLTARENISLPLEIRRDKRIRQLTDEMLEKTGLTDRQHHLPGQLSGGECQRVAIARALVVRPSLLLADEPTGNLDTGTGEAVAELLFDLVRKEGKSMVLVTHNPALAAQCRHICPIEKGRITP